MALPEPIRRRPASPVSIDDHARDNLRFIRETMERAASFTAVPGWGGIAMGLTALGAAAIAARQTSQYSWLLTWIAEAFVAIGIACWTTYSKARRANTPLVTGPARPFAYRFAPPLFGGALFAVALGQHVSRRRLRRFTHYFRSSHCEEIWWLNQERIVPNSRASVKSVRSAV